MSEKIVKVKIFLCLLLSGVLSFALSPAMAQETSILKTKSLTAEQAAPLALKDSMYYHFDEWFALFSGEINRLKSAVP